MLPVVFHNLRGYDMHHILKYGLSAFPQYSFTCIPQTKEKFMALTITANDFSIRFIDSLQFLNASLASLAKNVQNKIHAVNLPYDKGVFPYSFPKSLDHMITVNKMPSKVCFYDIIQQNVIITDEQYEEAKQVWIDYRCENLLDYMLIYLKTDVLLLADIFENFRRIAINEDELDPLNFFSIPGLSWSSALKSLESPIYLIQDPTMYNFFEGGIRGGMTFVNKHYGCNTSDGELLYIDVNNLYGWALKQKLPCSDLE